MKILFALIGAACLAVAYYLTTINDPFFSVVAAIAAIICLIFAALPIMKAKYIACCSVSVTQALLDVGIDESMLVCPAAGKLNYKFLMQHLKDYKYVVYDANATEEGTMALTEIDGAAEAAKAGAHVLVRFDPSSYAAAGLVDRRKAIEMLLTANQLQTVSTAQLQTLVLKYYAKKR